MSKPEAEPPTEADVQDALDEYAATLMAYPNVNGVGIQEEVQPDGAAEPVLQVYVSQKLPLDQLDPSAVLPRQLLVHDSPKRRRPRPVAVKVRVQEIGDLKFA